MINLVVLRGLVFVSFAGLAGACFPSLPPEDDDVGSDVSTGEVVNPAGTPSGVSATDDDPNAVTVTWNRVVGASLYRVFRCEDDCDNNDAWELVSDATQTSTTFVDGTATAGEPPGPPVLTLEAATTAEIAFNWTTPTPVPGPAFQYRVTAVSDDFESLPSAAAEGRRAGAAITGFELRKNGGDWTAVAGNAHRDPEAPAPTITAGTATATKGTFADHVQLKLSGTEAQQGAPVTYEIRAVTASGPTEPSNLVRAGRLAPMTLRIVWERSLDTTPDAFEAFDNAAGADWSDTEAPADGSIRHYRAQVSADGIPAVVSNTVIGSRAPPVGTVANFKASTDIAEHVVLFWDALDGATGYRLYRNGVQVAEVGASQTDWLDTNPALAPTGSWAAPTNVVATSDRSDGIILSWDAPEAPVGPDATYEIEPLTAIGAGPRSAPVIGRRVAAPLQSFEVEVPSAASRVWVDSGSTDLTWTDTSATRAALGFEGVTASRGDFMNHVRLHVSSTSGIPSYTTYRVRGRIANNLYTPPSSEANGARTTGTIALQWQFETPNNTWQDLSGATTDEFLDTTAPANGAVRRYRLRLGASGADTVWSPASDGSRLALTDVTAGRDYACALAADGTVWCWGVNDAGQLGRGTLTTRETTPARVANLTTVTQVSAGSDHTCARLANGSVRCWGSNNRGQLGDNSVTTRTNPVAVANLTGVTEVQAGHMHSCARLSAGGVRCWGRNDFGQLGDGTLEDRKTSVAVQRLITEPSISTTAITDTVELASYGHTSCVIRNTTPNRSVWCWSGGYIAGEDQQWNRYVAVWSGRSAPISLVKGSTANHACSLHSDGLWCWGYDNYRQISDGRQTTPYWASSDTGWGAVQINRFTSIVRAAVADGTTCVVTAGNRLECWGWGDGDYGNGQASMAFAGVTSLAVTGLYAGTFVLANHQVVKAFGTTTTPVPFP